MKVFVLVVFWLAIVVALPANRITDGQEKYAPIKRAKRSDSVSMDMNGFSYSHSFDVYENNELFVDASITAYKNWMSDKYSVDFMTAQLDFLHKNSGLGLFLGADQPNDGDIVLKVGGNKDIIDKKDFGVGISGQYNMDYNKYMGVHGDYVLSLNGRYRQYNWDVDKSGFDIHKMTPLLKSLDKNIVADVGIQKGWDKESWKTYLPDVFTTKLEYFNTKYHLTAYVGLNKIYHRGGRIFTGLSVPVWITNKVRGTLSTGYSWALGHKDDGRLSLGFSMRF